MSISHLQQAIRRCRTPLALELSPEVGQLSAPLVRKFVDLYGEGPLARAEALRYHGTQLVGQAAGCLPAVILHADSYLRCGALGLDVLANLVSMARELDLYTIVDARTAAPEVWLAGGVNADAVTVNPYYGLQYPEDDDKAVFALVRTEPAAAEVQNLMAGDRRLFLAAAEQMARRGAAVMACTDYSLDVRELRRRLSDTFLLLSGCSGEAAVYAFDDFGRGAMVSSRTLQYAPDFPAAAQAAIRELKSWITVV